MNTHAALAALAIIAAAPQACAAISVVISDNGTDLTMVATGSYDLTNALLIGNGGVGVNAVVLPAIGGGFYGWETTDDGFAYSAVYTGTLAGTGNAYGAITASANIPFHVVRGFDYITFGFGAPTMGTVNNTATFANTTLASLGMVAGQSMTGTWGLGGADETITITTVPEPSALLLSALGSLFFLRRKR